MKNQKWLAAIALISILFVSLPASAKSKEAKAQERLKILHTNLSSNDPKIYCEAVLTLQPKGFYPYCSAISYPAFARSSFTVAAGVNKVNGSFAGWKTEGGVVINKGATAREARLIRDAKAASPSTEGCLGQTIESCISFLASRFLLTTAGDIAFFDMETQASFDEQRNRDRRANLQIILPHTDTKAYPEDWGFNDRSPVSDVVGLSAYTVDGIVQSITMEGRYPILSGNPADYLGSGFAQFLTAAFPRCPVESEEEFYRSFWSALVEPASFSKNSGKWQATNSGLSKSSSSSASGIFCGMKVRSLSMFGKSISDEGRTSSFASKEVTFMLQ